MVAQGQACAWCRRPVGPGQGRMIEGQRVCPACAALREGSAPRAGGPGAPPLTRATEPRGGAPAWRWSRGADALALMMLLLLLGIAGAAASGGVRWLTWTALALAGILIVALVAHAATAGRRFGG